jgi:3-hydroxybutyryl-CoA dehydrogenase
MIAGVQTIAVLGAGTMGRGIAHVAAASGFVTHLFDVDPGALESSAETIRKNLDKGVRLGKIDPQTAAKAQDNLTLHQQLESAVASAQVVIEAVPESMQLKTEIFDQVVALAPETALFASNTSGLSITELAAASGRPQRFAGMHFFNPVHLMKLVELVQGLETSAETLELLRSVAERMGKKVVVVRDSPGFVTSRVNALIGNEAFRILESGVASARDIDTAIKLGLNHPMGPFELGDLVGLDVRLSILRHLQQTLGDLYRPSNLLTQYVAAGRLGRKAGRGVYEYDSEGGLDRSRNRPSEDEP